MRASVIIPCRNAAHTVIDSVRSALEQTEPPLEVLVVDDASTDGSGDAARHAGARVIETRSRRNAGGARNAGIAAAKGNAFAFLDGDALAPSDWLERVRTTFERDAAIVAVGGRIANGRPGRWGELDWFLNHSEWIRAGRPGPRKNIPTMGIVYRRDAVGDVRFPETNSGEDTAFALAVLARGGTLWYDPEIVLTHRHERLDSEAFREKQIACGRTIYLTRVRLDRPGKVLVRWPVLLFLFPHLWVTVARMARAGYAWRAVALFPWLVAGEVHRIRGFFEARKEQTSRREESPSRSVRSLPKGGASRCGSGSERAIRRSVEAVLPSRTPVAKPDRERARATVRLRQGLALARDWVAPGEALAQWTHFVTSVCNARCAHCFYPINAGKNELTLPEIERFVATLPPIRLLLISGGEPFLRRDLPEIIRAYFERCGVFNVGVPTNGFAAAEIAAVCSRICSFSPDLSLGISVSIDGFQEFHDRVRAVPGLYNRALESLESLLELARSTPNLTVGVTTVFMRDNQKEIEEFCEFVWDRYRPSHHSLGFIRGDAFDASLKDGLDVDLYERLSRKIDSRYPPDEARTGWRGARTRARREVNRRRFEYVARQARGGGFERFCHAGEREFVLTEDGVVYGCELIGTPLGNVRESGYDFSKIRKSEAVARFVTDKRARLCRCTHECNARTMILFDAANALPVLAAMAGFEPGRARPS